MSKGADVLSKVEAKNETFWLDSQFECKNATAFTIQLFLKWSELLGATFALFLLGLKICERTWSL